MRGATFAGVVRGTYDAVFRPGRFVEVDSEALAETAIGVIDQFGRLGAVFAANLLAYALPLTLAGLGTVPTGASGPVGSAIATAGATGAGWRFALRFVRNGFYLTGAAVATFVAFHLGVLLTRSSEGLLPSVHTVIYGTSAYLAAVFSFVMYLDTAEQFSRAAELVLWLQLTFVYTIIDAMGSDLVLRGTGRPAPMPPRGLTLGGQLLVAGLVVASGYYVYSMYLGSRVNHDASRITATVTVMAVLTTPVLFVVGSVLAVTVS